MAAPSYLLVSTDARGVATVTLNRPEIHNAFDDVLIAGLTAALNKLEADKSVRVVVLTGAGKSFSAGADLNWMKRMAGYTEAENLEDARRLAELMRRLNGLKKPTVALVQGAAYAGGLGLIACCDIVVCVDSATFALTETRLGLVPAVVGPYVVAAIGARAARRYFLSAERFNAGDALRLGLAHVVVAAEQLKAACDSVVDALLDCAPGALAHAKEQVANLANARIDAALIDGTAKLIARLRAAPEGREGVAAFLEKRKPGWAKG
ncbi:MAG: enoyl-CoA hydratase-related protein [Rhodospirillales bacterium]